MKYNLKQGIMTHLLLHHQILTPHNTITNNYSSKKSCSSITIQNHTWQIFNPKPMVITVNPPHRITTPVKCMANPRRVKMVAKQIMRELSDMLLTDKIVQYAILPEASLGADRYLSSLTTISDVEVSADLQVVKVYVSVFGDERGKEVAITGLKGKAKYVRSELGRRMKLRMTPEIRFIEDESLERGSRVIAILDKLKDEKTTDKSKNEEQLEASDANQDDSDWEGDDADEDIIYVK